MLEAAGAGIQSMPSSEIYTGLQTGVLTGANTSSGSFVSYKIYEQVSCATPPGKFGLWFMYEPILMSKKSFDALNSKQQDALMKAFIRASCCFEFNASKLFFDIKIGSYINHRPNFPGGVAHETCS